MVLEAGLCQGEAVVVSDCRIGRTDVGLKRRAKGVAEDAKRNLRRGASGELMLGIEGSRGSRRGRYVTVEGFASCNDILLVCWEDLFVRRLFAAESLTVSQGDQPWQAFSTRHVPRPLR
jgi:hypothetical protein